MSTPEKPKPETSPPPASPQPASPQTDPVRMSIAEALDALNIVREERDAISKELTSVKAERDQANSVLDGQVRAEYLKKIRGISSIPETTLQKMGNKDLENLINSSEMLKHSNPKSIMFATDDANQNEGVIDLYSERMKRKRGE
jgi:hypothetical protein